MWKWLLSCYILLIACSGMEKSEQEKMRRASVQSERIYRGHDDQFFALVPPEIQKRENYPWENKTIGSYPKITKEYFRCKGSSYNPPLLINDPSAGMVYQYDCGGIERHSLPVKSGKEYIYPRFVDILNYLQSTLGRVIITCGHRCPTHNLYAEPTASAQSSKHLIGAEVDFYIVGYENKPQEVVEAIVLYYKEKFSSETDLVRFYRVDKTDVQTPLWGNKEIFIKIYHQFEGRDFDNQHPYPYLSLQLRYDEESKKAVSYNWQQAFNGYMRW